MAESAALPAADRLQRAFAADVAAAIAKYPDDRQASAVLDLLYLAQAAYGRVTTEAIEEVASLLEMDATQVRGVVGFYSLFKEEPHGRMVVHYCTDLPCALRGAEVFLPEVCRAFGVAKPGETSPDGLFSVEEAMCLAACDRAPMMQVNLTYFHDLTPERLDAIVTALKAKADADRTAVGAPYGLGAVDDVAE
ncbi:MAG: NAD(P)H-dependent oxidoreductase subunit E [Ardenticatenales bacterium]